MGRPEDRKYTPTHEWLKLEGSEGTVGITDFAVQELSDIVFVDLPQVGAALKKGARFGEVESTKTVSDLICPASGTVIAVNAELTDHPEILNQSPFDRGWLIKIRLADAAEIEGVHVWR